MQDFINAEEVAYRLGVPLSYIAQMEEDELIESKKIAGEKFYDSFKISRLPGYQMDTPSLNGVVCGRGRNPTLRKSCKTSPLVW